MHSAESFQLVFGIFLAVVAPHYLASRLRIPSSVTLLLGGGALAFVPGLPVMEFDPELILVIFLPPLLADSAWFTPISSFRRHLPGILSLAIGAVLFTSVVVAVVAKLLVPDMAWGACAALGAIVSPPDAVSARAVIQHIRLPRRLNTLLEGESLLNDATGLVLLQSATAAVLTGAFSPPAAVITFVVVVLGGVAVGSAVAVAWMTLVRQLGDDRSVIAASTMLCWIAHVAGEFLHVSGVLATVTAGLICGWYQHVVFRGTTRISGAASWQAMNFLLEAAVFILIGFSLRGVLDRGGGISTIFDSMGLTVLGIVVAVAASRFIWLAASDLVVSSVARLTGRVGKPLGLRAGTVLGWAGMRGVVTLALALTLPEAMPHRDLMLVTAFAVILASVLIQGSTLGLVVRLLGPRDDGGSEPALDLAGAKARVSHAQYAAVARLSDAGGTQLQTGLLDSYRLRANFWSAFFKNDLERDRQIEMQTAVVVAGVAAGRK